MHLSLPWRPLEKDVFRDESANQERNWEATGRRKRLSTGVILALAITALLVGMPGLRLASIGVGRAEIDFDAARALAPLPAPRGATHLARATIAELPHYDGRSNNAGGLITLRAVSLTPGLALAIEPLESQLGDGATGLLKGVRYGIRRFLRLLRWSAKRWVGWTTRGLSFLLVALVGALLDPALVRVWRDKGLRGLRTSVTLALAVYVRLLLDRRAPIVGKTALAFAIAYGIASWDLVRDSSLPAGVLDDVVVVALASRCFLLLCPDALVEEHAVRAARARNRSLTWPRSRALPPAR